MLVKLLRHHRVISGCSRKISHQDCFVSEFRTSNISKRLLTTTSVCFDGKPVILSASDVVKEQALSTPAPVPVPAPTVDPISGVVIDPPFVDLGLATSWWPSHLVEGLFESFHQYTGLSWVATLAVSTAVLRLLLLPAFVNSRKITLAMSTHGMELAELRQNMVDKMATKNIEDRLKSRSRYKKFMKEKNLGAFRILAGTSIQPIAFVSCLRAISEMATLPVPSLAATSFLWISNLADPDPHRLLPAIAGGFIGLNLYLAVKMNQTMSSSFLTKYSGVIAVLPVIALPIFFANYSSAFGVYLVTNSFCTVIYTMLLANKRVKEYFNMPDPAPSLPGKKSYFSQVMKDSFGKSSVQAERKMEARTIRRILKDEKKKRAKELKASPSTYYEIGTEAELKREFVPDFERVYKPPRPDIFK